MDLQVGCMPHVSAGAAARVAQRTRNTGLRGHRSRRAVAAASERRGACPAAGRWRAPDCSRCPGTRTTSRHGQNRIARRVRRRTRGCRSSCGCHCAALGHHRAKRAVGTWKLRVNAQPSQNDRCVLGGTAAIFWSLQMCISRNSPWALCLCGRRGGLRRLCTESLFLFWFPLALVASLQPRVPRLVSIPRHCCS
mgnify:CR=1 FL=1